MTAGYDGTPENDDPFAYLYRSEDGEQADPAGGQPSAPYQPYGQPRTSYNQVQRVGERRSPQHPQGGYGYPPQPPQQQYGYDQGQQQAQQPQPGYGGATQQFPQAQQGYDAPPPSGGGHRGGGQPQDAPNRKGLLIAAVAVVVAVAVGIAFAMTNSSGDSAKKKNDGKASSTVPVTQTAPSTQPTPSATPTKFDSGKVDAATLTLAGGAQQSTQWPGANAANGTYVDHMGSQGASVLWTVTVPADGPYTLFISYGNAGGDAGLTLAVNGKPRADQVNLKNWGNYTAWDKAWDNHTYSWVALKKGANTLSLSCTPLDTNCGVNLDQVWLKQGQVTS